MRRTLIGLTAAAFLAPGCLLKETNHTIYLENDGAVTWSVMEQLVRSDNDHAGSRRTEEEAYLNGALAGEHDVAVGFRSLQAEEVRTTILRSEAPYTVLTEARFEAPDVLARALLDQIEVPAEVTFEIEGELRRLMVRIPTEDRPQAGPQEPDQVSDSGSREHPIGALDGTFDHYKLVLAQGRFLEAAGFVITDGGRAAVPDDREPSISSEGTVTLMLVWTTRE